MDTLAFTLLLCHHHCCHSVYRELLITAILQKCFTPGVLKFIVYVPHKKTFMGKLFGNVLKKQHGCQGWMWSN